LKAASPSRSTRLNSSCGCASAILSASDSRYELTPQALGDVDDTWRHTAGTCSVDQADIYIDGLANVFDLLVSAPEMAPERHEFTPPVRLHPHGPHPVIYIVREDVVVIVRVLGGGQSWRAVLEDWTNDDEWARLATPPRTPPRLTPALARPSSSAR
jgi:toxin ParE1/3/4